MNKSTHSLGTILDKLTRMARAHGLNDSAWAAGAGLRKETLSRLRRRQSCDFTTLRVLAEAVNAHIDVTDIVPPAVSPDGHFPARIDREYEQSLIDLCASRSLDPLRWSAMGSPFFMAGLAVMVASMSGFDRRGLLALAEQLHPGASEAVVFAIWLKRSPLRPSRFLPVLEMAVKHAA